MNHSRRNFLKSFGALAAAAVVAPTMLVKVAPTEVERLTAMMATGIIEDQAFLFHEPITIAFNNLIIRRCSFIFDCPYHMRAAVTLAAKELVLDSCFFDSGSNGADFGFEVLPQAGDMTSTLQSAINTLCVGTDTERALALAAGTYMVNSPIKMGK